MIYICKSIKHCKMSVCLLIILWIALIVNIKYNQLFLRYIFKLSKVLIHVYFK